MKRIWKKRLLALLIKGVSIGGLMAVASTAAVSANAAVMTEGLVNDYAAAMKSAANSKNVNRVAQLVSDDALISMSRKGKSTSLDKDAYLKLIQRSWNQSADYQYDIKIDNIVITGTQAKANVVTTESWLKDGKSASFVTNSRVTLTLATGNAILLRAVSQVTID